MQKYLDHLLSLARVAVQVETDPALVRAVETSAVHVDSSALRTLTGWQPRFTLAQTMADTLDFWRSYPVSELG
jgi:GDP-4-dehydro-6-deoxy-D-mannose reductase